MRQLTAGPQPLRCCTRPGRSPVAAAGLGQWSPTWQARQSHSRLATAAEASAYITDPLTNHAVPYRSRSAPKLQSRSMFGSPADGLWSAAAGALLRLELLSAATIDEYTTIGPAVMSVLAAASIAMGLDGITLLQHGLPPYFQDMLFSALGVWDTRLWTVVLTAVAVPATAWGLRAWWVSSVGLLSAPGGVVRQLQQSIVAQRQQRQQQQQLQEVATEQEVQEQPVTGSSSGGWLAALLAVVRGLCLTSAVSSISSALISSSVTGRVISGAAALLAAAVAATPVALLLLRKQQSSAAASLLAVEAAYVVALIGLAPSVNAVAAAVIAAGVWTLHQQLVAPRLLAYKASEGDEVEVHVSLRVAGTEAVFDSTYTADPLKLVAAKVAPEFKQAWAELSANKMWGQDAEDGVDEQSGPQQQEDAAHSTGGDRGNSSSSSTDTAVASDEAGTSNAEPYEDLRTVIQTQQSWMTNPEARWEALQPFAAEAACGMVLGETRSVKFFNPKGIGYWNPSFSWWQPLTDVDEKFRGQPDPGDVFWFPVSDGAYVQTRVSTVGDTLVELDANYGVTGRDLRMDVQLVRLRKQ